MKIIELKNSNNNDIKISNNKDDNLDPKPPKQNNFILLLIIILHLIFQFGYSLKIQQTIDVSPPDNKIEKIGRVKT